MLLPVEAALRALAYFQSLDDLALNRLARSMVRRTYTADEVIFTQGEAAAGLWIVETGRVKIFMVNYDGQEHILHLLGPGNSFNDIAALDGGLNPANASALSDCSVWLLPAETVARLLESEPRVAAQVVRLLADRVRSLVAQIEDLALHSVTIRLARFLLKQLEDPALSGPGITRAAIAAHLATQPETVSRSLRALEEAGAIRFDRHHIRIVREDLLKLIAAL